MDGDRVCAACGTSNPPEYRFCGECGTDLRRSDNVVAGDPADAATPERDGAAMGYQADAPPMSDRARLRLALLGSAGALALLGLLILPFGGILWAAAPLALAALSAALAAGALSGASPTLFWADLAAVFGGRDQAGAPQTRADQVSQKQAAASEPTDAPQAREDEVSQERVAPTEHAVAPQMQTAEVSQERATPTEPAVAPRETAVPERDGDAWLWGLTERQWGIAAAGAAALLMAVSLYLFPQDPPKTTAWLCFCASVALALGAVSAIEGRWSGLAARFRAGARISFEARALLPWAALGAIALFGAGLRLYNIDTLPPGLWFDEADNITQALHIANDPGSLDVYIAFTNLPSTFPALVALVIKAAGVSISTARIVAAAFGVAGIIAVFLMLRHMMGTLAGLIGAFLTATMRWDINFSRIGMHGIALPFFAALTAWLTYRAMQSERATGFALAGAAMGMGMWFYTPFRLFPLVMGFALAHKFAFERQGRRRLLLNGGVMAAFMLIVTLPINQFALNHSEEFFSRTRAVAITAHVPREELPCAVWDNFLRHMKMFHIKGDPNGRHNIPDEPMLDMASGLLMLAGLAVAAARWRDPRFAALPVWVVAMALPGVMSIPWEGPQSLRSIVVTPAVIALIAIAVALGWEWLRGARIAAARSAAPVALAALLAWIAYANINAYFGEQANHPDVYSAFSTADTLMARDMDDQAQRGYSPMVSRQFRYSSTAFLLGSNIKRETIAAPVNIPLDPGQVWQGAAIYLEPRESGFYDTLKAYYPGADFGEIRPPAGGDVMYYVAYISAERLAAVQGLTERRIYADGSMREAVKTATESVWRFDADSDEPPFDLEWSGALHITRAGVYTLALDGDAGASVALDGLPLLSDERRSARIEPAVGLHTLDVRARVEDGAGSLRLLWQPPPDEEGIEQRPTAIPLSNLYRGDARPMGLAGRFYKGDHMAGVGAADVMGIAPDAMRVTPDIGGAFRYDAVVKEPHLAVWEGTIDAPADGVYRFEFGHTHGAATRVSIDGEAVIDTRDDREREIDLSAGARNIRVEYWHTGGSPFLEVLWTPPGEGTSRLPPERLTPAREAMFRVVE